MTYTSSYSQISPASADRAHVLFGQTMGYVAATAGFFALGAYLGRDLSNGWAFAGYIGSLACLIGLTTVPVGNSSVVKVGNPVVAQGNAGGQGSITTTAGHVTGLNQTIAASDEGGSTASETPCTG